MNSTRQVAYFFQRKFIGNFLIAILLVSLSACGGETTEDTTVVAPTTESNNEKQALFKTLSAQESGIVFSNNVQETPALNYFNYRYMYNGGGVAVGDVNNDGLSDIYFTGNTVSDRLYINKGNLKFEDVTATALPGLTNEWSTGVTMADVNEDGFLDIYVCRAGHRDSKAKRRNLFFVNNGNGTFREAAAEYGIADTTRSNHAGFFDMDNDGDLDLFVLNMPQLTSKPLDSGTIQALKANGKASSCRLYQNNGGKFSDVSRGEGIQTLSHGLGMALADIDRDGQADIYTANDFDEPDRLYMKSNGGYSEEIIKRTRHISFFGMGCDIADYNNDGFPDIAVLDMVSEDHERSKMNMASMNPERFKKLVAVGYHHQYMQNTLQLNNGNGTFSELGQLANMARTDWSWAPLFADLDNDGWKDLVITNGYKRDTRNNDLRSKLDKHVEETGRKDAMELLSLIPSTKLKNYALRNNRDLTFENVGEQWGFTQAVNSNGMAYADLDNDGDLDLVLNNIDAPASILANQSTELGRNNYLRVQLRHGKRDAIGAKVTIWNEGNLQYQELSPSRGYQSTVEPVVHFGIGEATYIDSLIVEWPNGLSETHLNVNGNQLLSLSAGNGTPRSARTTATPISQSEITGLSFTHREDSYDDYAREVLLPHKYSRLGPFLSTADVDGDGHEDLFVSGAHGQASKLFFQDSRGAFSSIAGPWEAHAAQEQMGSTFFDADQDGDLDLLVVSGGNQHPHGSDYFKPQLYLNQGKRTFELASNALPKISVSAARVVAGDFTGDGLPDLFVGGRITPGKYPHAPNSYLLKNDGNGTFSNVTDAWNKELSAPGMITDAAFADLDGDQDLDLVITGEWMPVRVFNNTGNTFEEKTQEYGLDGTAGWWKSVALVDIDNDKDLDIVAGNIGENTKFHCSQEHPFHVYSADFDGDGKNDIVLAKEKGDKQLPVRGRQCSSEQCSVIEKRFPTFEKFAKADLSQIYGGELLNKSLHLKATHMQSTVFVNEGNKFSAMPLPVAAQLGPLNQIIPFDVNDDGFVDLIAAGNDWDTEPETVRYDSGRGVVLMNENGSGQFKALAPYESGFFAWNHVKDLAFVHTNKKPTIIVANNNGPLEFFTIKK